MNQWQHQNEKEAEECREMISKWRQGDCHDNLPWGTFHCVVCGEPLGNRNIMKFYNWDFRRITCYDCQDEEAKQMELKQLNQNI
jgi:hypothetical protein